MKHGAIEIWVDALMRGGDDLNAEIERKLRACDIFLLLCSPHSLSSDYIVDKEIAIIRERQAKGEAVHFYPLLLTPTPQIALDLVRDKNLRPRDGKPLSGFSINERYRRMAEVADEVAGIATKIIFAKRGSAIELHVRDQENFRAWIEQQSRATAASVAVRAALRALPGPPPPSASKRSAKHLQEYPETISTVFLACAIARVGSKYPKHFRACVAQAHAIATRRKRHSDSTQSALAASAVMYAEPFETYAKDAIDGTVPFRGSYDLVWDEVQFDCEAVVSPLIDNLADLPLWATRKAARIAPRLGSILEALPSNQNWDVWFDWYQDRLDGVSRGEAHELVFASVPLEIWDQGPAAANAWIKAHLPKDAPPLKPPVLPQPLPDLDAPFAFGWNASQRITILAGAQNLPLYPFFKSEEEHRHSLQACRAAAQNLLTLLHDGQFHNQASRYQPGLEFYLRALPKAAGDGNILIANDEMRVLHALFAEDANILPTAFANRLAQIIGNQIALNAFYDIVERHEAAVAKGDWSRPFPADAARAFFRAVEAETPALFEPNVADGLNRLERAEPPPLRAPQSAIPSAALQPPPLPPATPDATHSHQRQTATAANALWEAFLKGKDLPTAVAGWSEAARKIGHAVGPLIEFLRGLGA